MPSPSSPHRTPVRSLSAVSLDRDKPRPLPAIPVSSSPSRSSPLPPRGQSYFDRYPRPSSSRQDQHKSHEPRRPSLGRVDTEFISKPKPRRNARPDSRDSDDEVTPNSFAFPVADPIHYTHVFQDSPPTPKLPSRRRSRTNSNKMSRRPPVDVAYLRTSGSSTQTQVETPPQTPVDFPMPRTFIDPFPVVVSAPISGVETMDALVDGMNGLDSDDMFSGALSARAARKDRFHPLYQPPLPTPPPGVTLGGGMPRKSSTKPKSRHDDVNDHSPPTPASTRRPRPTVTTRTQSSSTITPDSSYSYATPHDASPPTSPASSKRSSKGMAPSISDIIRAHAPPEQQLRSRATSRHSSIPSSLGHTALLEEHESEPEPLSQAEEADMLSRSSVDSIADEVRRTLHNQTSTPSLQVQTGPYARSLPSRYSVVSDVASHVSPPSDGRRSSYYSSPAAVELSHTPIEFPTVRQSQSQSIAQYLRSARLTTLLKLTRSPHASVDNPLTVSLSDLGSPTGIPLVVFLGLGGVRYVMGLYDEMAECLGIRLITIDRWGLGRTDTPRHKSTRGIPEWASAVEEVLDLLQIDRCSVMAHSAGAPYALSFANKAPERIRGEVLLLAPWVGGVEGAGYKWLKYVPNGLLKTAQAAEWKIQAWMLGNPPTIAFQGIGYDAPPSTSSPGPPTSSRRRSAKNLRSDSRPSTAVSPADALPRPSTASSAFSEYDDLGDFEGRFDSRSTLDAKSASRHRSTSENKRPSIITRKTSRGFLNMLKSSGSNQSQPQSPTTEKLSSPSGTGESRRPRRPPPKLPTPLRGCLNH
ncbi:hypothetical protein OF83DRAFT_1080756 [Amylostereum chailletii]|nr:hypothetical protein OF83DRAFT_1080756 [Amylostereum chailletii]